MQHKPCLCHMQCPSEFVAQKQDTRRSSLLFLTDLSITVIVAVAVAINTIPLCLGAADDSAGCC